MINIFLGLVKTVYHAAMTIKETGEILEDGLHEVYVNTSYNDGSKIARLMSHFKETEVSDPEFPEFSRKMNSLKNDPKEVRRVCKIVEDYGKKEIKRLIFQMISDGDITIETGIKRLNMTEADILDEMEKEGYKIPVIV